jgi:hypothetical protein
MFPIKILYAFPISHIGATCLIHLFLLDVSIAACIPTAPLGRPRRRWVDNIKMDLREIGWDVVDEIDTAQDRDQWRALVNTVLDHRVP